MNVHVYEPDWSLPPDHRGERPCTCTLPEANAVHKVPPVPPEVVEVESRIVGESE